MTLDELKTWLDEHIDDIVTFTDYEPTFSADEDLAETLGEYWFGRPDWDEKGYRFVSLGQDGTGSEVAAWIRPGHEGEPPPVVLFGSEGGRGVLVSSPERWAMVLAHGVMMEEYPGADLEGPSGLTEENWLLEDADPEEGEEGEQALTAYKHAVDQHFDHLPSLAELTGDVGALNKEFLAWVDSLKG